MTQTKTGSPFYLLSLSNTLDLIRRTSVHSSSLLYFDDCKQGLFYFPTAVDDAHTSFQDCILNDTSCTKYCTPISFLYNKKIN